MLTLRFSSGPPITRLHVCPTAQPASIRLLAPRTSPRTIADEPPSSETVREYGTILSTKPSLTLDLSYGLDTSHPQPPGIVPARSAEHRLCLQLIDADTEADVETTLRNAGYWDDLNHWTVFGDNPANASMIGAQQEAVESALVEKIVNSIDARMLNACRERDVNPQDTIAPVSGPAAVRDWFDHGMSTDQVSRAGNVTVWAPGKQDAQAENITVAATGKVGDYASITVADSGEGQEPDDFGSTFCSLNTGNKRSISFVQGKHTMGGTGALRFCGAGRVHAHQLQLIVSRRNPQYASQRQDTPWGFTVVRRFPPQGPEKTHTYRYLAPNGRVLRFTAGSLRMFPRAYEGSKRAVPYGRATEWGTLTKLYEYVKTSYVTLVEKKSMSFARRLELRMPSALLPVKLYECRDFARVAEKHPSLVLIGITGRLRNLRSPSGTLEWDGHAKKIEFRVENQEFAAYVWAFRKTANAKAWRGPDGVVFALNGQTHAALRDSFFERKDVNMGALRKSLFVVVDCSSIDSSYEASLFMNSRDRLAKSTFTDALLAELGDRLGSHQALKDLRNERARFVGTLDEETQRSVQKFLENHLLRNPALGALLIDGKDISNPHAPFKPEESDPVPLRPYPTFFRLRKARDGVLKRPVHLDRRYHRFIFETDAADDFFDRVDAPGRKRLERDGPGATTNVDDLITGWYLSEGVAEMRLRLSDAAQDGDVLRFTFAVDDDNPETGSFVNTIELTVLPPKPSASGSQKKTPKRRPPKVDAPQVVPVYEADWPEQPEPFDEHTAIRRIDGDEGYELRYNADNKWLRHEIKKCGGRAEDADILRQQFGSVMALLALAVMDAHNKTSSSSGSAGEASSHPQTAETGGRTLNEQVDWVATAVAPVVASLPQLAASSDPASV